MGATVSGAPCQRHRHNYTKFPCGNVAHLATKIHFWISVSPSKPRPIAMHTAQQPRALRFLLAGKSSISHSICHFHRGCTENCQNPKKKRCEYSNNLSLVRMNVLMNVACVCVCVSTDVCLRFYRHRLWLCCRWRCLRLALTHGYRQFNDNTHTLSHTHTRSHASVAATTATCRA